MTSVQNSRVKLYNGVEMPWLGLGVHRAGSGSEVLIQPLITRTSIV